MYAFEYNLETSVAKAFVSEPEETEVVYSDAFVAELDRRTAEYKSGKIKSIPWDEAKSRILSSSKS